MTVDGPDEPEQAAAAEPAQAQAPAEKPVTQAAKTGIAEAVKKPAAPPPSARPVQTKSTAQTPGARPVTPASKPVEEENEKAPSPVDDAFAKLMDIE
jgi:hypothetical protein